MSIETQITALTQDRNDIRSALAGKGVSASTHGFDDFAGDISAIPLAVPMEINTAAGMGAVLTAANVGKAYKFTGTTDSTYTNGDIYIVEG